MVAPSFGSVSIHIWRDRGSVNTYPTDRIGALVEFASTRYQYILVLGQEDGIKRVVQSFADQERSGEHVDDSRALAEYEQDCRERSQWSAGKE